MNQVTTRLDSPAEPLEEYPDSLPCGAGVPAGALHATATLHRVIEAMGFDPKDDPTHD